MPASVKCWGRSNGPSTLRCLRAPLDSEAVHLFGCTPHRDTGAVHLFGMWQYSPAATGGSSGSEAHSCG
jgi:hypothetical protein